MMTSIAMFTRGCIDGRRVEFLAIWAALLLPHSAAAHPGQSIGLKISIADEAVEYEVLISADYLRALLPADRDKLKLKLAGERFRFLGPDQEAAERRAVEDFFKDRAPVTIDGVSVKPIISDVCYVAALSLDLTVDRATLPPDLRVVLTYPAKGRPRQVAMVWDLYPRDLQRALFGLDALAEVVAELDAYDENKIIVFMPEEPEIIWHAPGTPVKQQGLPVVVQAEPARLAIPLLTLLVLAGCGAGLLGLRRSRYWHSTRYPALAVAALTVAAAGYHHNTWALEVEAPWGTARRLPGAAEAVDIFASLHRNVYRAFDYKTESDIYDVLAQSVAGELLDQVYNEVYQSLIMRDQGGAVARVKSVDVLEAEVESAGVQRGSDTVAFRVRSRWRVHGAVYHWGHVHSRTNEYEALYNVGQRESRWRITGVEVLAQRRVLAEEEETPPTEPHAREWSEP